MIGVNRLVYAAYETPDLDAQIDHYAGVLGLTLVDRSADAAYLTAGGDRQTVVLRKGAAFKCDALGFQLPQDTELSDYAAQINGHGIATERQTAPQPGIGEAVVFADAKGTKIETFVEAETPGKPIGWAGVAPNKVGHVAFNCTDVQADVKWYCDVLRFKVSDWMGDFFAFLRCGSDHHTINLVSGAKIKAHHTAFELRDWTHIRDASDFLASQKTPLIWGPVRHGIGHNLSIYYRDPDGHIIELFCELDVVDEENDFYKPQRYHQTFPQKAGATWEDIGLAANMWGTPPPEGFLD